MNFLLSKMGLYAVAGWAVITLNFLIPRLMPGDPASALFARFKGKLKPDAMEALRQQLGLNDAPLLKQYWDYIAQLAQGEFGLSIAFHPEPVLGVIKIGFIWTVGLSGVAVLISVVVGTGLGAYAAWRQGGRFDAIVPPAVAFLAAFPYFFLAMILLFFLGLEWGLFPLGMAYGPYSAPGFNGGFIYDLVSHGFLPCLTIVLASLSGWLFVMRNTMIGVMGDEYVCLAHAKGLSRRRIFVAYAMRNALLPSLTSFGMALGFIVSGALLTEVVFSYPGLGYLLLKAILSQDYPLMQGIFLMITLSVLLANILVDALYYVLDPRTRGGR
ncbi:MAG: peptide ABC transporter permease [Myxococcales bacterium]|nr:peptide ABC transporter permease [Myxococcales bacterium]|tara:strand:+ start:80 stop:1060 length:981 start_codon:yes stop_codon:yes gene_type:complete